MLQYDWDESPGHWICTTYHALRRALNSELAQEGVTVRQWEVLACIAVGGALSQTELAERLGIEAPSLVGILDRMERDGWLERYACPSDRRKNRIRATEKAESLWVRIADCAHQVRARATYGMSPEQLAQLKLACETIRRNIELAVPPGGEPGQLTVVDSAPETA